MKKDLFIELAVEEIPSAMAPEIARSFSERFQNRLRELGVGFEENRENTFCFHTPGRFALKVGGVEPRSKDITVESFGPSEAAAFDKDGSPTGAALGFARSKGVRVEDLEIAQREKGGFLAFRQKTKGEDSARIIRREAPAVIAGIQCPKSMRWQSEGAAFARPIRKVSCFYGGKPLKIQVEGIPFSTSVSGHRFAGGKPFKPDGWESYVAGLKERFVIADPDERMAIIEKEVVRAVTEKAGGVFFPLDRELLETVNGLVEYPLVLSGNFEEKFLNLPHEALTNVMKSHQKYFPVFSKSGALTPHFVFVCGTPVKDPATVIKGNETVLRARFTDAEFFHSEDLKTPLENRLEALSSMSFLSGAGSYADKTERLEKIAVALAERTGNKGLSDKLKRAARLSKADLATRMVFEIPELQGTMGGHYAEAGGEDPEVSTAIARQYMPTSRGSALAETDTGALLAIADKMDSICVCFYLGMKPTGSSDPLALRRQAIGIIRTALAKNFSFSIAELADFILNLIEKADYSKAPRADAKEISAEVTEFVAGRFRGIVIHPEPIGFSIPGEIVAGRRNEGGVRPDSVEAVLAAGFDNIADCKNRLNALEDARKSDSFTALALSFKRVVNIMGDAGERDVEPELFENTAETDLWKTVCEIEKAPETADYQAHLKRIAALSGPVDEFFDGTMVMHQDSRIRKNRTAMLGRIKDLFFKIADLSKIETPKDTRQS